MSTYLARLKQIDADNLINTAYIEPTEPTKEGFDGFVGEGMGQIVKNNSKTEIISNWWLIHFVDLESVQVAIYPPCNHTGALAFNPNAIAAEPISSPIAGKINYE